MVNQDSERECKFTATLIALPKAFTGESLLLQEKACESWSLIKDIEVYLLGREKGIESACEKYGFKFIKNVETTELGTPILNSAFQIVRNVSRSNVLLYINADIVLDKSIVKVIKNIPFIDFLLAGRRIDFEPWDREKESTLEEWKERALETGKLVPKYSSDFFAFPFTSSLFNEMPQLIVGRKGWDNWIMYRSKDLKIPFIDGTKGIVTVHRKHGYSHIKDTEKGNESNPWNGAESSSQEAVFGDKQLNLSNADYYVDSIGKVKKAHHDKEWYMHEYSFRIKRANSTIEKLFWKVLRRLFI